MRPITKPGETCLPSIALNPFFLFTWLLLFGFDLKKKKKKGGHSTQGDLPYRERQDQWGRLRDLGASTAREGAGRTAVALGC